MPSIRRRTRRRAPPPSGRRASDTGPCLGIDLGGTKIAVGLVDRGGRVRGAHRHPTGTDHPPEKVLAEIVGCLEHCWGDGIPKVAAVGIGIAGQVDRAGRVVFAPNLSWRNVPLAQKLSKRIGLPVKATNDVRAITYGIWKHGVGRGVEDFVCLFIGTGVGGGIVANGSLRSGANNIAGEFGHMTIQADGRPCHCPNRGCWEAYVGGWGIAERAREAADADPSGASDLIARAGGSVDQITAATVDQAYEGGDPFARRLVDETVRYLVDGLVTVVNVQDPDFVVLGGGVMGGLGSFLDEITARVRARALPAVARRVRIVPARLGEYSGVIGAAAYARDALKAG